MITLIEDFRGRPLFAFKSRESAHQKCSEMNDNLSLWERSDGRFYNLRDIKVEDQ